MDVPTNVLLPGERLLWAGRSQRLTLVWFDWCQFLIGLLWGIATIVVPVARYDPMSFFLWVVGLSGLAFTWGMVGARLRARRSVEYVVTDRRIVLADRFSGRIRASAYLGTLPPPVARIRPDGSGTVDFGRFSRIAPGPGPSSFGLMVTGLVAVPEAGRVRDLIAWAQTGQA
ncbi:hypothetical protein AMES_7645 [Amycolatopsis mediterranei S699]|uniref:DUF304 domain-containing protein n=2 Tax=Amycolatopsis mediterranei TaxID=33910 RepID=A0A0H3DEW9_AMYMU|nr:hypothetical protein [Amycolatopsis mediterranei]ADJ49470.1 hypothetical protein AMED_7762 [Amycolatopsis mediterranei U32]AEK46442.1 hypothetical protein RAM_39875 [Amycolatopsis mediterranei S699]AFO81178.1 hypothetical protein AMES_7645 [Amycolatopsis mediterranei S699]AGT88306.1 hypothetical protein B737_7645 [Amycolatopsis mediterranei RB]KDO12716.1 hypothetical protein DV26_00855 [Amycolatopsis mediterranei]